MAFTTESICKALRSLENERNGLAIYDEESIQTTKKTAEALLDQAEGMEQEKAQLLLKRYAGRLQEGIDVYVKTRFQKIVEIKRESKGPISSDIKHSLSPNEGEFITDYIKAVAAYKREYDFDPTSPCRPPKGLNAEVTVIKGTGSDSICVGQQWMALKENEILTLRIEVAQDLENMGYVRINEFLK